MKFISAELPINWKVNNDKKMYEKENENLIVHVKEHLFGKYEVQAYKKENISQVVFTKSTYLPKEAFDIAESVLENYEKNPEKLKSYL